ncbi:MAG TPA: hypothetical protein VMQ17_14120 [Candidatus Sulfotelmatobacter sp.]|nr:hypothetical protein [Candidatus Sulfotelmatobacter sp.]
MPKSTLSLIATVAFCLFSAFAIAQTQDAVPHRLQFQNPPTSVQRPMAAEAVRRAVTDTLAPSGASGTSLLPVFNYEVASSRDGNVYDGVIVGAHPATRGSAAQVSVRAQLIPVILQFHTLGVSFDPKTGAIATTSGDRTSDPTMQDTACFSGPVNVPVDVMLQSPIFKRADFNFGGTDVGSTQYVDAFQRASFWNQIDRNHYHTLLKPELLPPLVVDVPADQGLSVNADTFQPFFGLCGPEGLVEITFLRAAVVSELAKRKDVNPGTFPMFMLYNAGMPVGGPTNINNCCGGGFHSITPAGPITFQTFSPFDFDVSGLFLTSTSDTATASHEVAEWVNDPFIINRTPAWGHTGQVAGCQSNLEVGDPLTGNEAPRIAGNNGFTYHLQELAFFSWFFGNPSLGIHGWDSNNGTFLSDAGPVCVTTP